MFEVPKNPVHENQKEKKVSEAAEITPPFTFSTAKKFSDASSELLSSFMVKYKQKILRSLGGENQN